MNLLTKGIFVFFISNLLLINTSYNCFAQSDSAKVVPDSMAPKKVQIPFYKKIAAPPTNLFVGIDAAKLIYNFADPITTRIEATLDAEAKNNKWYYATIAYANGKVSNSVINYQSNSIGASLGVSKSWFGKMTPTDKDNGFIGLGLGAAYNRIGTAQYTITDIWGTSNGAIAATNKWSYWVELGAGYRIELFPKVLVSTRIFGRSLINQNSLLGIAPIYVAPYGKGNKVSNFGYLFNISYQLF
jgi:hypothetical protein